jgi:ribonuclease HI
VLIPSEGDALKYVIRLEFPATNNITESEALVNGLRLAKDLGIRRLLTRETHSWWPSRYRRSMTVTMT